MTDKHQKIPANKTPSVPTTPESKPTSKLSPGLKRRQSEAKQGKQLSISYDSLRSSDASIGSTGSSTRSEDETSDSLSSLDDLLQSFEEVTGTFQAKATIISEATNEVAQHAKKPTEALPHVSNALSTTRGISDAVDDMLSCLDSLDALCSSSDQSAQNMINGFTQKSSSDPSKLLRAIDGAEETGIITPSPEEKKKIEIAKKLAQEATQYLKNKEAKKAEAACNKAFEKLEQLENDYTEKALEKKSKAKELSSEIDKLLKETQEAKSLTSQQESLLNNITQFLKDVSVSHINNEDIKLLKENAQSLSELSELYKHTRLLNTAIDLS